MAREWNRTSSTTGLLPRELEFEQATPLSICVRVYVCACMRLSVWQVCTCVCVEQDRTYYPTGPACVWQRAAIVWPKYMRFRQILGLLGCKWPVDSMQAFMASNKQAPTASFQFIRSHLLTLHSLCPQWHCRVWSRLNITNYIPRTRRGLIYLDLMASVWVEFSRSAIQSPRAI